MSKALGSTGGFILGSDALIRYLGAGGFLVYNSLQRSIGTCDVNTGWAWTRDYAAETKYGLDIGSGVTGVTVLL